LTLNLCFSTLSFIVKVLAVIPARYASIRLPGKPLANLHGKPMIRWVYERTSKAKGLSGVVVATDDARVEAAVKAFGGKVAMTSADCQSGTDRVAAVARMNEFEADAYLNVQGDEPLIEPEGIEKTVELLRSGKFSMTTLMTPLRTEEELKNPAVVKVIFDRNQRAIYFSRHPIPYSRKSGPDSDKSYVCRRHVGIYGYTKETLMRITGLPVSDIELGESLEQLRALQDGIAIGIVEADFLSIGVDTPEELEKARERMLLTFEELR
jgi:3-deoxy-manno-octulosonate cytidylyltransferase (CMP-KDO synthetase)